MSRAFAQGPAIVVAPGQSTAEIVIRLNALLDQQSERLVRMESDRASVERALREKAPGEGREQYRARLADADVAIAASKASLAETRRQIAEAQRLQELAIAVPPSFAEPVMLVPPPNRIFGFSEVEIGVGGTFLLLFPFAIAAAVRLVRRAPRLSPTRELDADARFARIEQMIESVAIEVERIGESQRFTTKLLTERNAEPLLRKAMDASFLRTPH